MTTTFGAVLKDVLAAHRLSQNKAAELADYDHSYISRLVDGTRMPTREFVDRLVTACGFSADESRQLFEAACFIPAGAVSAMLPRELREAAETLEDESIPWRYRDGLRRQIRALVGITRQMAA